MHLADIVWGTILGAGAAYEGWALATNRTGDTLSERTRAWFHTHTAPGRAIFLGAWSAFAVWFAVHITTGRA